MNLTAQTSNADCNYKTKWSVTVLVVDHERPSREMFRTMLNQLGDRVLCANNAQLARTMALAWRGKPIDLLITDLAMPDTAGIVLASELRAVLPSLKVIFTSGYSSEDPEVKRIDLRNTIYLPKPVSIRELDAAIHTLFAPGLF